MSDSSQHLNLGALVLRDDSESDRGGSRTVLVTGVGRSGTSMIANVLKTLGLPMGNSTRLAVQEDRDFRRALLYFDSSDLKRLIDDRNERHPVWGVKFPSLQNHLFPQQFELFRNPRLVVIFRDPAAITLRSLTSEANELNGDDMLLNVVTQQHDLTTFARKTKCPVLLLSYEKTLMFPTQIVEILARFCGLPRSEEWVARAVSEIMPNNPKYIQTFHPHFLGYFDGVRGDVAVGWCRSTLGQEPVVVDLVADEKVIAMTTADRFREDLLEAGVGDGHFGFVFDLSRLDISAAATLRVQVSGHDHVLESSYD